MKVTVLMDNNTLMNRFYLAEPAFSLFVEADERRVLFDAGYSDAYLRNAQKMGIDLRDIDDIVLSHGHLDHTWGLAALIRLHIEARMQGQSLKRPRLIAHPDAFGSKRERDIPEVGLPFHPDKLKQFFDIQLCTEPFRLSERLVFLGEIERTVAYEPRRPHGRKVPRGCRNEEDDFLLDDSGLAYCSQEGLVILVGCSHAGICNICEHARAVCQEGRIQDIIGGFHLVELADSELNDTLSYLQELRLKALHACHCTNLESKLALADVADLEEVGVGLTLEFA